MLILEENAERNLKVVAVRHAPKLYLHKYCPWINTLIQIASLDGLHKIKLPFTDKVFSKNICINPLPTLGSFK